MQSRPNHREASRCSRLVAKIAVLFDHKIGAGLSLWRAGALLILWIAVLVPVTLLTVAHAAPIVWAVPSLERVRPTASTGTATQIALYAAQGETESFQIIVRAPTGGLTNVNVVAPDIGGPTVTLYREHYVYLTHNSDYSSYENKPEGPGWYPDGLIPFVNPDTSQPLSGAALDAVPFNLADGRNQPIWVDVTVPRGTLPGQYGGVFTVTSNQGQASVTLNLTVWNFALPLKPNLKSSFLYWQIRRQTQPDKELLLNRVMPISVNTANERSFIDSYGLTSTSTGFYAVSDKESGVTKPAPTLTQVLAAKAEHEPDLFFYNYTADEILGYTSLYAPVRAYARVLHAAGVANLVTVPPISALMDDGSGTGRSAVDIWVELPKQYDAADVAQVLAKGDEVWSYTCLSQDDYSPKWLINYPLINYRIQPGFINQSLGMTGILYWSADYWSADPWDDVESYAPYFPGEGMLVYPGANVGLSGVVPSMRLKSLRDGVDDYDYIELLKQQGLGDWALSIARGIGADWHDWTRDPAALEAARLELGQRLSELGIGTTHLVTVTATASPTEIGSGQVVSLGAVAVDSEGHEITSWSWSDGGIGGSFNPSSTVQSPLYTAPTNSGTENMLVRISARASCGTGTGTGWVDVIVRPGDATTFYDVPESYWAYNEIMACYQAGIIAGYPDHGYRPTWPVSRGAMATYISRALAGGDAAVPPVGSEPRFPDVPPSSPEAKYVEYAAARNIVTGYQDGLFHPDWTITRGQMAVFIARSLVTPTGDEGLASYSAPSTPTFRDVPATYWAYKHIEFIAGRGVALGFFDGLFRPAGTCTRDQMAVYLTRAYSLPIGQ